MNIVLYVHGFLPSLGGRQFVVHHLANALQELGHAVRVLGPSGFFKHRNVGLPYPVHRWPTLRGFMKESVWMAQLALDTSLWGCDVIHAHSTYPSGYTAVRFKRTRQFPVVITPHGGDIQTIPEMGHGLGLDPTMHSKIEYAVKGAEFVTAVSDDVVDRLVDAGANRDRVRLVRNGVDLERFDCPPSPQIRQWLGVEEDARLLVTVGNYRPLKGQDYLVRAMPRILASEPRARLVIIGRNTEALEGLITDLGLNGKVVLTGAITPPGTVLRADGKAIGDQNPRDYLAEVLRSSELYVSAGVQKNAEGLSLALLEAMAAGLPLVATAISGNTDVVRHDENGLLVEPANERSLAESATKILNDERLQARMAAKARGTASRYAWVTVAREYLQVYDDAVAAV
ncbi:MAG: glycosyltransferase family 4 protein [Bacteroidetes bacterium]|nr:glycosyltransferase family 4 protein [Bacteroidota bacterium]